MNRIDSRLMTWLVWALPFLVISALIGWETDWGRALKRVPRLDPNVTPQPVSVALLPEYRINGGVDVRRETVNRTLFNPTRRPAPPAIATAAASSLQPGQFVLTGTTVVDKKATAFLREVNGGRSRRVQLGETINGMLVAEVRADGVKLTQGGESENLTLKVASGPRVTIQPVQPAAVAAGQPAAQPGNAAPVNAVPPQAPQVQDVADVLANRRRAARAAEATTQGASGVQPAVPAVAPAAVQPQAEAAKPDPAWNEVYRRYMQPRQ